MKFLVVLICITANNFWTQDLDRFNDEWFFNLRAWLSKRMVSLYGEHENNWLWVLALIILIPLLVLGSILYLVNGVAFGLLTLVIHVFVLLFAIDRTHPGMLAQDYLVRWREGDFAACYRFLQEQLAGENLAPSDDARQLHANFGRLYSYRCFEKMFVMIFWYMITGPVGVLLVYVFYQYRDEDQGAAPGPQQQLINTLLTLLEWIPVRLLGLTFCLVGDFESCFARLRALMFDTSRPTDEAVYDLANSALGLEPEPEAAAGDAAATGFREQAAMEIDAMKALLERSQIIWICFLALATVFGLRV